MRTMKNHHIARLESQLEQLIEGAFASLFGKRIRAQDVALRLARAMEDGIRAAYGSDPRPVAPDQYIIYTHPQIHRALFDQLPNLSQALSVHLVELATQTGYRLTMQPQIKVLSDIKLDLSDLVVVAGHSDFDTHSTAVMQIVEPVQSTRPQNAQLIIDNDRIVPLEADIINIGRHLDNQIVIDDPHVSRHHAQLRLRFGCYILFDIHSQSGTFVNSVQVKEHQLKSGDVIRMGKTHMLYSDDSTQDFNLDQTDIFDPFE